MSQRGRAIGRQVVLLLLGAIWIVPLYLILINAVTSPREYATKAVWSPPSSFGLGENLRTAWNVAQLGSAVGNTLLYAVAGGLAAVFLASLAAFAIVALRVRWGFVWFLLIYSGTIFPFQMYLSPLFSHYADWGLYNTRLGLLLLYTAITIPFAVFVIRNHFVSISLDMVDAARLDGASAFRIYRNVFVPLSMNAFASVFILQFTWIWNDLLFGLVLSRSADVRPIMTALAALGGQQASTGIPVSLAGTLIVSVPTFVLFFAVQRFFVSGLRVTA